MKKSTSSWTIGLLLVAILLVVGYRYDQYVIEKNFLLEVNTVCDPAIEGCFVADCSPADDPLCDTTPYKKIEIKAYDAPNCLEEHACESFLCDGIESCTVTYCADDTREEWELCTESTPVEEATSMESISEVINTNL